jgi:hypothetical protein
MVSTLAMADAAVKLLIEKGVQRSGVQAKVAGGMGRRPADSESYGAIDARHSSGANGMVMSCLN